MGKKDDTHTIIVGIKKSPDLGIYEFTKGKNFLRKMIKVLQKAGFADASFSMGDIVNDKLTFPYPRRYTDIRKRVGNKEYDIHFIFGHKKIFMFVISKEKGQEEISKIVLNDFKWPKGIRKL